MAWNGADGGARGAGETVRGKTRGARRRGIALWAALLVAAACATLGVSRWLSGGGTADGPAPSERRPSALRAHAPSARGAESPTAGCAAPVHGGERPARKIPDRVKPDENGVLRWPGGARYVEDYYFHTNAINPYAGQKQLFKAPTDIHISTVVNLEPGQMIIGGYTYDSRFDERFRKSLEEPVEFSDDDTEEERRKKQEVVAAREVLREAMGRGESPAKVLQEARDELVRLFQYRQNLREMLTAAERGGDARESYDAYRAANEMLRERGLSEFSTRMVERRLERLKKQEEGKSR